MTGTEQRNKERAASYPTPIRVRDRPKYHKQPYPYEAWLDRIKGEYGLYDNTSRFGWRRLDEDWLVSTRINQSYPQNAFHLCYKTYNIREGNGVIKLDGTCDCGESVPEGVRMMALLLESL